MADYQVGEESNDFEVLPRQGAGFMSINSATSGDGDPYEKRSDIIIVSKGIKFLFIGTVRPILNYKLQLPDLVNRFYLLDIGNYILKCA